MLTLLQIIHKSLISTGRTPRWWILALAQVGLLAAIGELARPGNFKPVLMGWFLPVVFALSTLTVWFWLGIEAKNSGIVKPVKPQVFVEFCLTALGIILFCLMIIGMFRLAHLTWIFSALFSSLVSATALLAMLYAVLCGQLFLKSFRLALFTWQKKTSLAALSAFVFILGHGFAFALVHGAILNGRSLEEFSVLNHSATIWILLFGLAVLISICAAFLNCFLVTVFLETINRKKDSEYVEKEIIKQSVLGVINLKVKGD